MMRSPYLRGILLGTWWMVFHLSAAENVDFAQMQWFAKRAAAAYQTPEVIQQQFAGIAHVATIGDTQVQYFLEQPTDKNYQLISVRGTFNRENILEDAEYLPSQNPKLGIYVHSGFDKTAYPIFTDVLPRLDSARQIYTTGHSLGAAVAALLMMYLKEEGFTLADSMNFGQPMVTNGKGAARYSNIPMLRVIDENDIVPLLPAQTLLDSIHGAYQHLGAEIILLSGIYYVYANQHVQRQTKANSFWQNLDNLSVTEHTMQAYMQQIAGKLAQAKVIPYAERERYIPSR